VEKFKKMKNTKNEEIKFKIEMELIETIRQDNPRRAIKLAQKNLKKMFLNRLGGKTGEC
jgi:hypothetical protein